MSANIIYNLVDDSLIFYADFANPRSYISGSDTLYDLSHNRYTGILRNITGTTSGYNPDGTISNSSLTYNTNNLGYLNFDNYGVPSSNYTGSCFSYVHNPINFGSKYTIDVWVRLTGDLLSGRIWIGGNVSTQYHMNFYNGDLYSRAGPSGSLYSLNLNLPLDVWHNITFVRNDSTIYGYKNGVLTQTSSTNYSTTPYIMHYLGHNKVLSGVMGFGRGDLSSVKIYNKVLTQNEIKQNYNIMKNRFGY